MKRILPVMIFLAAMNPVLEAASFPLPSQVAKISKQNSQILAALLLDIEILEFIF